MNTIEKIFTNILFSIKFIFPLDEIVVDQNGFTGTLRVRRKFLMSFTKDYLLKKSSAHIHTSVQHNLSDIRYILVRYKKAKPAAQHFVLRPIPSAHQPANRT